MIKTDKDGLLKDPSTNSIVSTNIQAYHSARQARKRIQAEQKKYQELNNKVDKLEQLVSELIKGKDNV